MDRRQRCDARQTAQPASDTMNNASGALQSQNSQHDTPNSGGRSYPTSDSRTDSHQQSTKANKPDPAESSTPRPSNAEIKATESFDDALAEFRTENQPFHPFSSDNQVSDWFIGNSVSRESVEKDDTDFLEAPDDGTLTKQPEAIQEEVPARSQAEPCQASGNSPKPDSCTGSDGAMKPPEVTSNTPKNSAEEDPHGFGALDIPIIDQYPCFQLSADDERIEIDESVFQLFQDQNESSFNVNTVIVGNFLELPDLPNLKQADVPKPAPEHVLQDPLAVTTMREISSTWRKKVTEIQKCSTEQGNKVHTGQGIEAYPVFQKMDDISSSPTQRTHALTNPLNSRSPGKCVIPKMRAMPSFAKMQPQAIRQESNPHFLLSKYQGDKVDQQGPLSHMESTHQSRHSQLQGASPFLSTLSPPSEKAPGKKPIHPQLIESILGDPLSHSANGIPAGSMNAERQPKLQHRASHTSLNHQISPTSGGLRSPLAIANANMSQIPSTKGHPLVTPTSILCPEMLFEFQNTTQNTSNAPFPGEGLPLYNVHQINKQANVAWGTKIIEAKRRISDVGSSYETPTKKARAEASNPPLQPMNERSPEDLSQTSRIAQIQHHSPNISASTHPTATTSKNTARTHNQKQTLVVGTSILQREVPSQSGHEQDKLSNFGGPKSEATVSSPSKRSTDVRDERGQGPKRFICSECSAAYAFKENCERHFKVVHQGRTVYFCHHCSSSYLQAKTMRCHVDKKHHVKAGVSSVYPCYWCEFKTNTEAGWSMHVSEMHPGHKNTFRGSNA